MGFNPILLHSAGLGGRRGCSEMAWLLLDRGASTMLPQAPECAQRHGRAAKKVHPELASMLD